MSQQTLFDPKKISARCPACGEVRPQNCRHNHDMRHDAIPWATPRPKGCLATAQNRDGVPY